MKKTNTKSATKVMQLHVYGQAARELVETELASWGLDENYPRLDKLVYTLETQLVFNPASKS